VFLCFRGKFLSITNSLRFLKNLVLVSLFPKNPPILHYKHALRSRYSETDQMGYVYYGRYLEYFEVARTEMIRSLGLSYRELEQKGIMLPVVESHIKYKAPLFYDDQIKIHVYLFEKPVVRMETYYKMFTPRLETLHAAGKVSLCFVNERSRKPCRAPKIFLNQLSAFIKNNKT
jgi:acyl-CoA thioester hydrolase